MQLQFYVIFYLCVLFFFCKNIHIFFFNSYNSIDKAIQKFHAIFSQKQKRKRNCLYRFQPIVRNNQFSNWEKTSNIVFHTSTENFSTFTAHHFHHFIYIQSVTCTEIFVTLCSIKKLILLSKTTKILRIYKK